jgi:hypothetical protein
MGATIVARSVRLAMLYTQKLSDVSASGATTFAGAMRAPRRAARHNHEPYGRQHPMVPASRQSNVDHHDHQSVNLRLEQTSHLAGSRNTTLLPHDKISPYPGHRMRSFPETGSVAAGNPSYPTHNIHNHSFMGEPAKSRRSSLQTFINVGGNMTQLHLTSHGNSGMSSLNRARWLNFLIHRSRYTESDSQSRRVTPGPVKTY